MKSLLACFVIILSVSGFCRAGTLEVISPGEYVRSGDSGWLKVERKDNQTIFSIGSIGGNCHICGLSGQITGTIGRTEDETLTEGELACRISMKPSHGDREIEIKPLTYESCRDYCGMRADFEGVYRKPPELCTISRQKNVRSSFIRHYRLKQYKQALSELLPLIETCGNFLNWIEIDRIRNDLALAYFRSGNAKQCLKTLKDTRAAEYVDAEKMKNFLPPCDFDNYISTAQATWHNIRLCSNKSQ